MEIIVIADPKRFQTAARRGASLAQCGQTVLINSSYAPLRGADVVLGAVAEVPGTLTPQL